MVGFKVQAAANQYTQSTTLPDTGVKAPGTIHQPAVTGPMDLRCMVRISGQRWTPLLGSGVGQAVCYNQQVLLAAVTNSRCKNEQIPDQRHALGIKTSSAANLTVPRRVQCPYLFPLRRPRNRCRRSDGATTRGFDHPDLAIMGRNYSTCYRSHSGVWPTVEVSTPRMPCRTLAMMKLVSVSRGGFRYGVLLGEIAVSSPPAQTVSPSLVLSSMKCDVMRLDQATPIEPVHLQKLNEPALDRLTSSKFKTQGLHQFMAPGCRDSKTVQFGPPRCVFFHAHRETCFLRTAIPASLCVFRRVWQIEMVIDDGRGGNWAIVFPL